MDPLAPLAARLARALEQGQVSDKEGLQRLKQSLARDHGWPVPSDRRLIELLPSDVRERYRGALRTKPARSLSGVAVVAVMTSPASCPHGKCIFCPGGPDVDAPQSYTGFEPSTLRARRHGYDPYAIVRGRLAQLERNGHAIDKVEIVIQGGTFPARDLAYQEWVVAGIYAGCSDGPGDVHSPAQRDDDSRAQRDGDLPAQGDGRSPAGGGRHPARGDGHFLAEGDWAALPAAERAQRFAGLQAANEGARCRVVGLTIETKPDWCFEEHLDGMLRLGATRVEVGLQCLDDDTLRFTNRGHTLDDSRRAMRLARDAGFKVCVHLMPGLPRPRISAAAETDAGGMEDPASARGIRLAPPPGPATQGRFDPDPEADIDDFARLFAEPDWRPDMLKVYPTLVVMEGETALKRMWERGEYTPYDTQTAARLIAKGKESIPEWCRIQRVDRDIPTTHIEAGVMNSNLREYVDEERVRQGLRPCRCIRHREAGRRAREGADVRPERVILVRRDYEASGGQETFLALEDPVADALVAFLRLRRVGPGAHRTECDVPGGAAFVRELKVYGVAQALGQHGAGRDARGEHGSDAGGSDGTGGSGARVVEGGRGGANEVSGTADNGGVGGDDPEAGVWQHKGHGARLLAEAERIAYSEWGVGRLLVIAGVGVKPYYRRHGFVDCGPYVAKDAPAAAP